jgi:hypothetical protein
VTPQIGDGPLNIVIDGPTDLFTGIDLSAPVTLAEERLWVGGLQVDLREAIMWEPQPDWDTLRARRAVIASHLPLLCTLGHHHAPSNTLLALLEPPLRRASLLDDKLTATNFSTAQKAGAALREGWPGDLERLQQAGTKFAGLGGGLTPAGDDFLTGAMLWAWLAHLTPDPFCHTLLQVAVSHTTTLSAAFLRAAARGECSASWHALLASLSEGTEIEITAAARVVLAHGATSGGDTLAGFLYIPIMIATPRSQPQPSPDTLSPH